MGRWTSGNQLRNRLSAKSTSDSHTSAFGTCVYSCLAWRAIFLLKAPSNANLPHQKSRVSYLSGFDKSASFISSPKWKNPNGNCCSGLVQPSHLWLAGHALNSEEVASSTNQRKNLNQLNLWCRKWSKIRTAPFITVTQKKAAHLEIWKSVVIIDVWDGMIGTQKLTSKSWKGLLFKIRTRLVKSSQFITLLTECAFFQKELLK